MKSKSFFIMGTVSLLVVMVTQTSCGQLESKSVGKSDSAPVVSSAKPAENATPPKPDSVDQKSKNSPASSKGQDWPVWTGNGAGNLYSPAKGIAASFEPGKFKKGTEEVDMNTTKNVKWVAKLGSSAYGNTTIANGKVYVGTNNESPRDERHIGDRGILYCLDEATGELQWQLVVPKLKAGKSIDWEYLGICSSPSVEGDRVYVVANSCEILCLDVNGMKDGNQGFQGEAQFMVEEGKKPLEPSKLDADVIWRFDMKELDVYPHNIASSSVLIHGDLLFCTTSNGQDWSHENIPSPNAPCIIALNKIDGTLAGEEAEGISKRVFHGNWSSPSKGKVKGKDAVFFGGGDGVLYAFETGFEKDKDGYGLFKTHWKYDCVPKEYKKDEEGNLIKYPDAEGPSEIIATPTYHDGHVYVAVGQDPEHGEGVGVLTCIKADTGEKVWDFRDIQRTISSCAIDPKTGLLITADYTGYVYCLDAKTGKKHWVYDTKAHMWSSPFVVDGKVYIGDEDGDLTVLPLKADFDPKKDDPIFETNMLVPIYSTPVVANGTLYIGTQTHLYAVQAPKAGN